MKRTIQFPVFTDNVVFSDEFNGESVKTAALPVKARVLQFSGDVFQSHTPDL